MQSYTLTTQSLELDTATATNPTTQSLELNTATTNPSYGHLNNIKIMSYMIWTIENI